MVDHPRLVMPPSPILTPFHIDSLGWPLIGSLASSTFRTLDQASSISWGTSNAAYYYPFRLFEHDIARQLLWLVGATSGGNIDIAIYNAGLKKIIGSGAVAMSATVNTVQQLNIADTELPPGDYLLGASCSLSTGTCFGMQPADELGLSSLAIYGQASAHPLPDPAVPSVFAVSGNPNVYAVGIQFADVF